MNFDFIKGLTMQRKALETLVKWKANPHKKALLITGARQIGKTYLVRQFAKQYYENFYEINFLTSPKASQIFDGDLDANTIIANLSAFLHTKLVPKKSLIFLDEIQECPNARTAIKFLVEDGRFDYIESGSLLGVNYKVVPSYPVGFEQILQMYPMDFEEFCIANSITTNTLDYLKQCFESTTKVTASIHQTMSDLFRYYIVVGGMPEVVKIFVDTHDIGLVIEKQKDILAQYRQDITKYTLDNKVKVTNIFEQIPAQLDEKNRRFKLSSISKTARLRDYDDAFMWLKVAGVALCCYNLTEPKIPLKINEQSRLFKLFLSDCGLLCAMSLENVQFDILQGDLSVNMGSILENVFAKEFVAQGFALRYLNKRTVGELDFVLQQGSSVLPIEIKSGKTYQAHAALDHALEIKDWNLKKGYVFCQANLETKGKITYLPWYMVMFLKPLTVKDLKVEVKITNVD